MNEVLIIYLIISIFALIALLMVMPTILSKFFSEQMEKATKQLLKQGKIKVTPKGKVKFS